MESNMNVEAEVIRRYHEGGILTKEETEKLPPLKVIDRPGFAEGSVKYEAGLTINIGNFENVKVTVGVTLPCLPEELTSAYQAAQEFVDGHLGAQKEMIDTLKTGDAK